MFTCSKKKPAFKNLTVGKEYEGIEDGEMVVVVNDIGARARYSKEYFTGTVEAAPRRGRPPRAEAVVAAAPPPPPPPLTLEEFVSVTIIRDGGRHNVSVSRRQGGQNIGSFSLSLVGSSISCGIYEISGISGLSQLLAEMQRTIPADVTGNTIVTFVGLIMTAFMAYIRATLPAAFWLFSDAIEDDGSECVHEWLNINAVSTSTDTNPNSSNVISLWVMGGEGGE